MNHIHLRSKIHNIFDHLGCTGHNIGIHHINSIQVIRLNPLYLESIRFVAEIPKHFSIHTLFQMARLRIFYPPWEDGEHIVFHAMGLFLILSILPVQINILHKDKSYWQQNGGGADTTSNTETWPKSHSSLAGFYQHNWVTWMSSALAFWWSYLSEACNG